MSSILMQASSPITFHVGLHKTGTSYLQHCVFPRMLDINYVKHNHRKRSLADTIARINSGGPILVSQEALSGEILRDDYPAHRDACLRLLAESYPGSKIVVFLREPSEWLASIYRQRLLLGETQSFRAVVHEYIENGSLDYNHLLDRLRSFPFSNILALRHEDLQCSKEETLQTLCDFVGCARLCMCPEDWTAVRKVGVRNAAARTLRLLNHVCTLRAPRSRKRLNRKVIAAAPLRWLNDIGQDIIPSEDLSDIRKQYAADWSKLKRFLTVPEGVTNND